MTGAADLAYDRRGAGPALVLLHPLGGDRHVWSPVLDRVAAERDAIALDLPGFGGSAPLNGAGAPTPRVLAAAVARFLDGLGIDGPPHVAGNSLGAWVALELALAGHARSVCAIAPAGLWPEPRAPRRGLAQLAARAALPVLPALVRSARGRRIALAGSIADPERVSPEDALRLVRAYARAPGFEAVNAAMRAGRFTELDRIRVAGHARLARHDRLVARPRRLPAGVRSVTLRGAGHLPMWDAPELVARLLVESSAAPRTP